MGIGDQDKGWLQLSMILGLAGHLNIPPGQMFAREDYSIDSSSGSSGERKDENITKYAALYRTHLGMNYNEHDPEGDLTDVGDVVKKITANTLLFAPNLPHVTTAMTLKKSPADPAFFIGSPMKKVIEECKKVRQRALDDPDEQEDEPEWEVLKLDEFGDHYEDLHDWYLLPKLNDRETNKWNERMGEFQGMALNYSDDGDDDKDDD